MSESYTEQELVVTAELLKDFGDDPKLRALGEWVLRVLRERDEARDTARILADYMEGPPVKLSGTEAGAWKRAKDYP